MVHHRMVWLLSATVAIISLPGYKSEANKNWYWGTFDEDQTAPTSFVDKQDYKVAHSLWFHNGDFFAVINKDGPSIDEHSGHVSFSINTKPVAFPVVDIHRHYNNIQAGWVSGPTLWVDFPFTDDATNLGYWAEILVPIYSQLTYGNWKQHVPSDQGHIRSVLFSNLDRDDIQKVSWIMELVKIALRPGLKEGQSYPRILFWDELKSLNVSTWLGFEHLIHVPNRYDHAQHRTGFYSPAHAQAFRSDAYAAANIPVPAPGAPPPRTITYIMAAGNPAIANSGQVLKTLRQVAARHNMTVRPYSATTEAPFASLVAVAARSGVVVGRHGPLLANSLFLPPGGGVLELLQYNWEWREMDQIYLTLTSGAGDVHHVGWKPESSKAAAYVSPSDARYGTWTPEECSGKPCLEAHERAGLRVDVKEMSELLEGLVSGMERGDKPDVVRKKYPWPQRAVKTGNTGLWWDTQ